jgi:hypothetical protein
MQREVERWVPVEEVERPDGEPVPIAIASRRSGLPGSHASTSLFGGSRKSVDTYHDVESSLPEARSTSYTVQRSALDSPSSGWPNETWAASGGARTKRSPAI